MIQAEQLHARILEELDLSRDIPDEELTELIHRVLDEASGREYIPLGKKAELGRELFNAFRKFDLLQEFLEDDKITEIMINGTENIFLEKEGKLIRSGKRFVSREKLEDVIQQIVAGSNRIVNEASPIVDARLPDGSRVNGGTGAHRFKWAHSNHKKISKRGNYNETVDPVGFYLPGSKRISGKAC